MGGAASGAGRDATCGGGLDAEGGSGVGTGRGGGDTGGGAGGATRSLRTFRSLDPLRAGGAGGAFGTGRGTGCGAGPRLSGAAATGGGSTSRTRIGRSGESGDLARKSSKPTSPAWRRNDMANDLFRTGSRIAPCCPGRSSSFRDAVQSGCLQNHGPSEEPGPASHTADYTDGSALRQAQSAAPGRNAVRAKTHFRSRRSPPRRPARRPSVPGAVETCRFEWRPTMPRRSDPWPGPSRTRASEPPRASPRLSPR